MVAICLGLTEAPKPDDAADALAIGIWAANSEREGEVRRAGVLDRAAVAPIERRENPFDRAVREALAHEKAAATPGRRGR